MSHILGIATGIQSYDQFAFVVAVSKTLGNFRNFTQLVGTIYHRRNIPGFEKFVHIIQILVWFKAKNAYVLLTEYSYHWSQEKSLKKSRSAAPDRDISATGIQRTGVSEYRPIRLGI